MTQYKVYEEYDRECVGYADTTDLKEITSRTDEFRTEKILYYCPERKEFIQLITRPDRPIEDDFFLHRSRIDALEFFVDISSIEQIIDIGKKYFSEEELEIAFARFS